ncbi:hypothetical protein [Colwellia sp. E150_009]
MTEHIEIPHKIKNFDAVAHEAFIRECAHEIIQANKSSIETVQAHVSQFKEKLKAHKQEQNQFKITQQKADKLADLAAMIRRSTNTVGC